MPPSSANDCLEPDDPRLCGPVSFLFGRLSGRGKLKLLFGLITIPFEYEGSGELNEEHRAVYYDAAQVFPSGRRDERSWVIYADHTGHLLGRDAKQEGALTGRWTKRGFEFAFAVRVPFSSKPNSPALRVTYKLRVERHPVDRTSLRGSAYVFGILVARVEVEVTKQALHASAAAEPRQWMRQAA